MTTLKPGIYRHYKGNYYQLLYTATHSETLEPMVVYKALYGECGIWVRPAGMWDETVEVNGKTAIRFEFLADKLEDLPNEIYKDYLKKAQAK